MACRKHRQQGSTLTLPCRCRPGFKCVGCDIHLYLKKFREGEKLWDYPPMVTLKKCRDLLALFGDKEGGQDVSFKSWRPGKATSMARIRCPWWRF